MDRYDNDALIDRFVTHVNRASRQRIREGDLPVQLREGGARFGLYYSWTIQRFSPVTWIQPLEEKLKLIFPPSYRSLISRYVFPAFPISSVLLLGNTGHALYNEMSYALFRDRLLSEELLRQRFIQIARPDTGEYDPVCFDARQELADGEYPVVRLHHACILRGRATEGLRVIAPSFRGFIERVLGGDVKSAATSNAVVTE